MDNSVLICFVLRRVRDDLRRGPPPPYRSSEHLPEVIVIVLMMMMMIIMTLVNGNAESDTFNIISDRKIS